MEFDRILARELRRLRESFPVIVVHGARQVGKTWLLEHCFPGFAYVSLDSGVQAEAAATRPGEFLDRLGTPAIIDEIQYAPSLLREIKVRVDRDRGAMGRWFLTGSRSLALMASVSESLAGRAAVLPLHGLSGDEWLAAAGRDGGPRADWGEFFFRGSWPGLWAEPAPPRERWYQGYLATYIERDVRNALRIGSLRDFERFLRAAGARTAQTLNLSELGRDVGIAPSTAREWMSVLVASNLVFLLEPYHRSLGKRIAKSPKLYFPDTGLAAWLAGFGSRDALERSPQAGAFFENYVVGQWLRRRDWLEPSTSLWYWRDQSGAEVDLVVERDGLLHPIECKRKERPDRDDCRGIRRFTDFYGKEAVGPATVACLAGERFEIDEGVLAVDGRFWMGESSSGNLQ